LDPGKLHKKFELTVVELAALLSKSPTDVQLFDVREPNEIEQTGSLPGAVNIPLTKLKSALMLHADQFQDEFGVRKPNKDDTTTVVVFYGHSAVKSSAALEIAYKLGYKKARFYPGGWEEWSATHGLGSKV